MLKVILGSMASILLLCADAQVSSQENAYQYFIDLNKVDKDQLKIVLITPKLTQPSVVYHLPAIVPGTYAIYDFGRYISQFKAYNKKGDTLAVRRVNVDSWSIDHASALYKITYNVDDTWDSPQIKGEKIFEPAGTNFEANKDFMLNTFALAGFFEGFDRIPYELTFTKPANFYGATALVPTQTTATTEKYTVSNYRDLADAPIMFSKPDTTILKIGGADILIAVYSPNKKASSDSIAKKMKVMLEAQKEYLGGSLPVKKYAFLIALTDNQLIFNYGALEHSYSSFYFLPEWFSNEKLSETIIDAASHEFFHILTPLSIHSHEIGDFDFEHPVISKHLWLYEGMTEYEAQHMQVKYHLIDLPEFLNRMSQKINTSKYFNDSVSFTVMSKGVLDTYKNQFINVYMKGALINLCLDIKLRQLSGGKYGTQDLMKDLSKKYGKDKAFNDDELFDTITALTYPSIRNFFADYVEGAKPLPYFETFDAIGVQYAPLLKESVFRMGIEFGTTDSSKRPVVISAKRVTAFGNKLGLREKDQIVSINGTPVAADSLIPFINHLKETIKEGDDFTMIILRRDQDGLQKQLTIHQKVELINTENKNVLKLLPNPTAEQLALRAAWLNTNNSHN